MKIFGKLLVFLILSVSNFVSPAQDDTLYLNEIMVNACRVPTLYSESARVITIIDREEIKTAPVQSIPDLLEYALNVDVRQYGNLF